MKMKSYLNDTTEYFEQKKEEIFSPLSIQSGIIPVAKYQSININLVSLLLF